MDNQERTFRTFIWNILRSDDLNIAYEVYQRYMSEQYSLGRRILYTGIPQMFDASFRNRFHYLLGKIALLDPFLYYRLPYIVAFGYSQGSLTNELRNNSDRSKEVGITSAMFNTIIALFDYIVDEFPAGRQLFEIINDDLIIKIMDTSSSSEQFFDNMTFDENTDIRIAMLILLITIFSSTCKQAYARNRKEGNKTWQELSQLVLLLYHAEKNSTELHIESNYEKNITNLSVIRCKSVMPSITLYTISKLFYNTTIPEKESRVKHFCKIMGTIFWITDDLSDAVKDLKLGKLTYVTLNAIGYERGQNINNDTFSESLILATNYLLFLISELKNSLNSLQISESKYNKLLEFVLMYITSWIKQ